MIEEKKKSHYLHYGIKSCKYPDHEECEICNPPKLKFYQKIFKRNGLHSRKGSNEVNSAEYTLLTFIPLALIHQFRRKANIYFLLNIILATTKYSSKNPYLSSVPFIFVIFSSIIRQFYEFLVIAFYNTFNTIFIINFFISI